MIHPKETLELAEIPTTNQEELGADAELYQGQPPLQLSYDPANIGTLTAEMMDRIEREVFADEDAGKSPSDIQASVYDKLAHLGIDPATAQGDALVVRFVGIDGKADIRPVVISAQDFGTRIRNVELTAVEAPATEEAADPEIERVQERQLQELLDTQAATVQALANRFGEASQDYARRRAPLDDLISEGKRLALQLQRGEGIGPGAVNQLTENVTQEAYRLTRNESDSSLDERVQASRLAADLEDAGHSSVVRNSGARGSEVSELFERAASAAEALVDNRRKNSQVSEDMSQAVALVGRILDELRYSRTGHEMFGAHLSQGINRLEELSDGHDMSDRQLPEILEQLKRTLTQN